MNTNKTIAGNTPAKPDDRKAWTAPLVTVILPASITQGPPGGGKGGGGGPNGS